MTDARDGNGKRRVAVLGAGPAGLAAAFALTRTKALRERHDVTIYQAGWRAGGKSATGRAMDKGWRIEQNGSHYLFGCYGNSFAMVREAYEVIEAEGDTRFGRYRDQFVPRNLIVATGPHRPQPSDTAVSWEHWYRYLPETPAWPDRGGKFPPVSHYLMMAAQIFLGVLVGLFVDSADDASRSAAVLERLFPLSPFHTGPWARFVRGASLAFAWIVDGPVTWLARVAWRLGRVLRRLVPASARAYVRHRMRDAALWVAAEVRAWWVRSDPEGYGERDDFSRRYHRARVIIELLTTAFIGAVEDRLWEAGRLEAIDHLDLREWLRGHGASDGGRGAVACPLIKIWYDAVVAYENGGAEQPRISAPVTLYALFRAVAAYKGAFAFQMTHEIGDSFIAPIVRALQLRGVKFEFFHRVRDIVPGTGADAGLVQAIEVDEQIPEARRKQHQVFVPMTPTGAAAAGAPPTRAVWPNRPVFEGEDLRAAVAAETFDPPLDSFLATACCGRRTLRRGEDFDEVVMSLPSGVAAAFPGLRDRPEWAELRDGVKAVGSQSMRLWFTKTLEELGWTAPAPILSGYRYPFSTWEDNGQNRGNECFGDFDAGVEPSSIATLFGPLESANAPHMVREDVQAGAARAMETALGAYRDGMAGIWPRLADGTLDPFGALLAPTGHTGERRFAWQYVRANVGPVEAYVLALPGTLCHRLRPEETGFRNMYAAGEWTRNGLEVGCVEGAVMSGFTAARAIARSPIPILAEDDLTFGPLRPGDSLPA